jgi:ribosome-associated translation inhibitor RaiA
MNPASQSLRETCLESLKLIRSSNPSILVIMRVTPEISFRNFEATNGIRDLIHEEVLKLETFYDRIIGCSVMMEVPHRRHEEGNLYHVRVRTTIPGRQLVVSRDPSRHQAHEDPYVAVRDAFAAMRRRLDEYAGKRRGKVRTDESAPAGGRSLEP